MTLMARVFIAALLIHSSVSITRAADCESAIARHMVGQALLAAHFVALAEKSGMAPTEINAIFKSISEKSAKQEFWITDSHGHAYLSNAGIDFTFNSDVSKQPQASEFWPLIDGRANIVIQRARQREIDNKIFKYVGVKGVDKSRIVQVGVDAANLC